jgi:hypothetical protein
MKEGNGLSNLKLAPKAAKILVSKFSRNFAVIFDRGRRRSGFRGWVGIPSGTRFAVGSMPLELRSACSRE